VTVSKTKSSKDLDQTKNSALLSSSGSTFRSNIDPYVLLLHEARTPLSALQAALHLMEDSPQKSAALAASLRLSELLGASVSSSVSTGLVQILSELKLLLSPLLQDRSLELSLESSTGVEEVSLPNAHGSFKHILLNLLSNALRFSEPGSSVKILCDLSPGSQLSTTQLQSLPKTAARKQSSAASQLFLRVLVVDNITTLSSTSLADKEPHGSVSEKDSKTVPSKVSSSLGIGLGLPLSVSMASELEGALFRTDSSSQLSDAKGACFCLILPLSSL